TELLLDRPEVDQACGQVVAYHDRRRPTGCEPFADGDSAFIQPQGLGCATDLLLEITQKQDAGRQIVLFLDIARAGRGESLAELDGSPHGLNGLVDSSP